MTSDLRTAFRPGSRGFVAAIVAAQVLTQIGAFTLSALLPGYIERWHLTKNGAGNGVLTIVKGTLTGEGIADLRVALAAALSWPPPANPATVLGAARR